MKRWCKCAAVLMALVLLCGLLPLGVLPTAAASVNRIQNGDFENQLDGWTIHQSTVKVSTTAKYEDAYGLVAKGNGGWGEVVSQPIELTPNSDYIIRYTVKAISNGVNFVVSDPVGIAGGNQHARLYTSYYSTSKGSGWTTVEAAFHSGANDSADFILYGSGKGTTDEVWVDNIAIERIGGDDPIPNRILSGGETSISEDVNGLAFRFQVAAAGARTTEKNEYVAGSATIRLYRDMEDTAKLIGAGAILTNNANVGKGEMTLDAVDGKKTVDVPAKYLCETDADSFSFAVRVIHIPESHRNTNVYARPYYIYEDEGGNPVTVYGDVKVGNYNHAANPRSSIKILSLGHSFSKDVMENYLYDMLKELGYEEIVLGYLHVPGASLSVHWDYISNHKNGYRHYGKTTNGTWVNTNSPYAIDALLDEDWDYVTLQTSPDYVGGQNQEYSYIPAITDWIKANATNPNVEIKWHMIWAFSQGCDLWSYAYHNNNQMTMYQNIVEVTKQHIVTNDTFTGIIPSCTAIQNARSSFIGDNFNEPDATQGGNDGYHLNTKYGDFVGSLTWACYFSGVDADTITLRSKGMTEAEFAALAEAVNNALDKPLEVTLSTHP